MKSVYAFESLVDFQVPFCGYLSGIIRGELRTVLGYIEFPAKGQKLLH